MSQFMGIMHYPLLWSHTTIVDVEASRDPRPCFTVKLLENPSELLKTRELKM